MAEGPAPGIGDVVGEILRREFSGCDAPRWNARVVKQEDDVTVLKVRVWSRQASRSYWVKTWKAVARDKARNETLALSELQGTFSSSPRLSVPRLVTWDSDGLYLVTEDFGGTTFRSLLLRRCTTPGRSSRLAGRIDDIVDWLRLLQTSAQVEARLPVDMDAIDHELSHRLSFCSHKGFLPTSLFRSVASVSRAYLAALEGARLRLVPVHGDFGPINILISAHGLCVVDFESYHHGAPYADVSYMCASLWAMSVYNLLGRARLRGLAERFCCRSRVTLGLDDRGLSLGLLRVLIEKTYFGLKGFNDPTLRIPDRCRWLARAYCYRHMLASWVAGSVLA